MTVCIVDLYRGERFLGEPRLTRVLLADVVTGKGDLPRLTPRELEDIVDPFEEVTDPLDEEGYRRRCEAYDFPSETFRVLKEKETRLYNEYRTKRLVLEAWARQRNR